MKYLKLYEYTWNPRDAAEALFSAIKKSDLIKVKEIIEGGFDVNSFVGSHTPLMKSCFFKNIEIIKYLLDSGADPNIINKHGNNAFIYAISSNPEEVENKPTYEIAELLIKYGAIVDVQNKAKKDSLTIVANHKDFKLMNLILKNGATPKRDDKDKFFWEYDKEVMNWVKKNYPEILSADKYGFFGMKSGK